MPEKKDSVIHWFRRDLRIADNLALSHAAKSKLPIIPVYIISEWRTSHAWTGPNRQHFLCESLQSLARNLETLEGRLIVRRGKAVEVLRQLIQESHAVALHFNADPDPFGKSVEKAVFQLCSELGVECHAHADATLHGPDDVLTQSALPYRVFTPYSKNWLGLPKASPVAKPDALRTPADLESLPLPTVEAWDWKRPKPTSSPPANAPPVIG